MSLARRIVAVVTVLAVVALLTGAGTAENAPPTLSNFTAVPHSLGPQGGEVVIEVDAVDDSAVESVGAVIYFADGAMADLALESLDDPARPDRYAGTLRVPVNGTDQAISHNVEVSATDDQGETTLELLGSIEVEGQPPFDQAPDVFDAVVTPLSLPSQGGEVLLSASATDDRAISEVYAVITGETGADVVALSGVSSGRYEGTWDAPANPTTVDVAYSVEVTALDDIGQSDTEGAGEVKVVAVAPTVSRLSLTTRSLSFGPVRAGRAVRRAVVLRNEGPDTVTGTVPTPARPFALVGARGSGFALKAGQSRRLVVVYRSVRPGRHRSVLRIVRSDMEQPHLRVVLRGTTIPRR